MEKEMATHSSIHSCLENPSDRKAWQATVHGVAKSWTQQLNYQHQGLFEASVEYILY